MPMNRLVITWVAGIALAVPSTSHACSKVRFHGVRSVDVAHFLGVAMADTVFAGAGAVRYRVAGGHFGRAVEREVFGQVVSLERIGGLASQTLRQPVSRVVLVPWDYGPDCTPTPWPRSAAWLQPGTRGLFTGVLRDSAHWAGGVPTFDIFTPEAAPYREQVSSRNSSTDSFVSADELFDLMDIFPDSRLLPDSAEAATAQLFAWARANPTLVRRYPIAEMLAQARGMVAMQRLRAIKSPLMGTYEMKVSLSGGPPRTFYARTFGIPTSPWYADDAAPRQADDPTMVSPPEGYHLLAAVAESLSALPERCEQRAERKNREGYIKVVHAPFDATADARSWTGKLEVSLVTRAFPDDTALAEFGREEFSAFRRRSRSTSELAVPARFSRSDDGIIRVEQVITVGTARSLTITGARISPDVIACRS